MHHVILAKRSSGGFYRVDFIKDDSCLRVRCNCSLGAVGQICRHKRALIAGNSRMLHDAAQSALLREILAWPETRLLAGHAGEYEKKLEVLERKKVEIEDAEQLIKRRYASDCLDGIHEL
jgi:hypothetical protein